MVRELRPLLIFAFAAYSSACLVAQEPVQPPPAQGVALAAAASTCDTPPAAFDADTRASVKAFKRQLDTFYCDVLNGAGDDVITQDLRSLRFAANARTATSMLNSGLGAAVVTNAFTAAFGGLPDQQTTAQPTATGSTSLVSKAGGASVLALAIDAGALTNTVSGTTSTISGNLEGVGSLLTGQSPISIDPLHQSLLRKVAGDVNLVATFALAQPSTKSATTTAPVTGSTPPAGTAITIPSSVGKLTGITALFTIHNPFNPHSSTFRTNWTAAFPQLQTAANTLLQLTSPLVLALDCSACQADWTQAQTELKEGATRRSSQDVANAYDKYVAAVLTHAQAADVNFATDFTNAVKATAAYQEVSRQATANALGSMLTAEYDFGKQPNQPETHDFKVVYGYSMSSSSAISSLLTAGTGAKSLFTANAGVSIYGGSIPASGSYGRLHYGQVSAEFDRPIIGVTPAKQAVLSLAGYWQYQPSPSVISITQSDLAPGTSIPAPTQVLVGTAGSLWVTQAKITISNGKSGVNVPIGVKWSNKTDLLSGSKVGAQIGISYDFSSLSNLFGGSN